MLTRKSVILAKLESVYDTDPVPTGASNAILVSAPEVRVDGELLTRDYVRESLSSIGHIVGKKKVMVTFETEFKKSSAAGTAPEVGALYQACGLKETITGGTSAVYAPESDSTAVKSATLYVYFDGMLHRVTGCRGNFSFNCEAGGLPKLSWSFEGKYNKPEDALLPATTFDGVTPDTVVSANFTVDSYAAVINALTFDLGNTIGAPGNVNSSDGYGELRITARDAQGSIDPESITIATQQANMTADYWADWANADGRAISIQIGDGDAVTVSIPNAIYREIGYGDREGVRTYQMPFSAAETGSHNDEITITYSYVPSSSASASASSSVSSSPSSSPSAS